MKGNDAPDHIGNVDNNVFWNSGILEHIGVKTPNGAIGVIRPVNGGRVGTSDKHSFCLGLARQILRPAACNVALRLLQRSDREGICFCRTVLLDERQLIILHILIIKARRSPNPEPILVPVCIRKRAGVRRCVILAVDRVRDTPAEVAKNLGDAPAVQMEMPSERDTVITWLFDGFIYQYVWQQPLGLLL